MSARLGGDGNGNVCLRRSANSFERRAGVGAAMKIALSFPGCHRRAGVERIVFECARFLAGRGNDVTVYTHEWERDETQTVGYECVPVRKWPGFLRGHSYFKNATRHLRRADFDVLGTHGCVCPTGGVPWVQSV